MFPISNTFIPVDFFESFGEFDPPQAILITQDGFALIEETQEKLDLRRLPRLHAEGMFWVGFRNQFDAVEEIPADVGRLELQPLEGLVLVLFRRFCGVFKQGEVVDLEMEIENGERVMPLEELAVVAVEQHFTFVGIEVRAEPEEDPAETIRRLEAENKELRAALADCDPEMLAQLKEDNAALRVQISQLKDSLAERDKEILALKAQIKQLLEGSKRTPEDFATAISHSVNHLQTKLSNMPNSVSDFVVREFDLEAKVYIDVNEEGQIDYRFVQPGDNAHPLNVSNLSLKLMPVPKQNNDLTPPAEPPDEEEPEEPVTPAAATPASAQPAAAATTRPGANVPVERISGDAFRDQLSQHNIHTAADLLQVATRARTIVELSALLGIERQRLGQWVTLAQLMMIDGLSIETARLLVDLGVTNLRILAGMEAEGLLAQYNNTAAARGLSDTSLEEVKRWIATAILFTGGAPSEGEASA